MTEATAVQHDAHQRTHELRLAIKELWPSRSEPEALSELHSLLGQLRQAEAALTGADR